MSAAVASSSSSEAGGFGRGWQQPRGAAARIKVYNSLTRSKVPLVPMDPAGRKLTMYVCGPTVYDAAHLGHARTYIQFDVIRRVLRDVAGYEVIYVMNVTDVDDKIILRSRERGVTPEALARQWEAAFLADMATLNVERPTLMPRVTEYMSEIVAYVAKIVENGFGYEDGAGSVYFDTTAFAYAGFEYAKLVPENVGSAELMAEGEGKLANIEASLKRDPKDFALWKASKPGEPTWPSPWGPGRPGWHIECSAMIDATVGAGGAIDFHGGGVDLRFPHHDNELAQSEAFCQCGQTVNYFAHTGHLNIRGLKMSKSLKNFVTIAQALRGVRDDETGAVDAVRPSTMRLMFCQVKYNAPCDYSDAMLNQARILEKKFHEFFLNVAAALRPLDADPLAPQHAARPETDLLAALAAAQTAFTDRLFDDFDTPAALLALQSLVDAVNAYLRDREDARARPVSFALAAAARFVADALRTFGLADLVPPDLAAALAYPPGSYAAAAADAAPSAALAPILDALAAFRDDVRRADDLKAVLAKCDALRDDVLPDLGVRLEDKGSGSVWKLDDPDALRAEKARKLADAAAKADKKLADARRRAEDDARKRAASLVKPEDLFRSNPDYSNFDDLGIPSHDATGAPLSKNALKNLKKQWEKQKKLYDKATAETPAEPPAA